jgi:hypothetical protein
MTKLEAAQQAFQELSDEEKETFLSRAVFGQTASGPTPASDFDRLNQSVARIFRLLDRLGEDVSKSLPLDQQQRVLDSFAEGISALLWRFGSGDQYVIQHFDFCGVVSVRVTWCRADLVRLIENWHLARRASPSCSLPLFTKSTALDTRDGVFNQFFEQNVYVLGEGHTPENFWNATEQTRESIELMRLVEAWRVGSTSEAWQAAVDDARQKAELAEVDFALLTRDRIGRLLYKQLHAVYFRDVYGCKLTVAWRDFLERLSLYGFLGGYRKGQAAGDDNDYAVEFADLVDELYVKFKAAKEIRRQRALSDKDRATRRREIQALFAGYSDTEPFISRLYSAKAVGASVLARLFASRLIFGVEKSLSTLKTLYRQGAAQRRAKGQRVIDLPGLH